MTETQPDNNWPPRLSLKGLLALVTVVALLLAPCYWFGGFYLYSVGCSLLFIYVCTQRYRKAKFSALTPPAIVAFAIFFTGIASLVFFFQAVFTAIMCIPLALLKVRPRTFAIVLVVLMAAIYGVAFAYGIAATRELRARYPFTSLESRLAFERDNESKSAQPMIPITLSSTVARHLNEQDSQEFYSHYRASALRMLHDATYQKFALSAGFGPARMMYMRMGTVDLSPADEFTLPTPLSSDHLLVASQELQKAHDTVVEDFISPERMGYIKSRNEVVGFQSHRFTSLNKRWRHDDRSAEYWQVVRLELVGLLRDQVPRVYIAKTIPEMEQLASTPHRELNDFERAALPQLQSQEDIVIDQKPDRIQMLGALRAGKSCLECHHGDRGKLLGAFSYTLVPFASSEKTGPAEQTAN